MNLPSFSLVDIIIYILFRIIKSLINILQIINPKNDDEVKAAFSNPIKVETRYMNSEEYLDYMERTRMGRGGQSRHRWFE